MEPRPESWHHHSEYSHDHQYKTHEDFPASERGLAVLTNEDSRRYTVTHPRRRGPRPEGRLGSPLEPEWIEVDEIR